VVKRVDALVLEKMNRRRVPAAVPRTNESVINDRTYFSVVMVHEMQRIHATTEQQETNFREPTSFTYKDNS